MSGLIKQLQDLMQTKKRNSIEKITKACKEDKTFVEFEID